VSRAASTARIAGASRFRGARKRTAEDVSVPDPLRI
jgi:hypothetical protein